MSLDGMLGIRSLVGRPNRHMAGDIWVSGLGLFLYTRSALWNDDMSVSVFPAISRLTVFTPVSARGGSRLRRLGE